MSKLFTGSMIVLAVGLVNFSTAWLMTQSAGASDPARCCATGNITACQSAAQGNLFIETVATTFTGVDGMETSLRAVWGLIGGGMLAIGFVLIAQSWVPLLGG